MSKKPSLTQGKISGVPKLGGGLNYASILLKIGEALMDFEVSSIETYAKTEQFSASLTTMLRGNKADAEQLSQSIIEIAKQIPSSISETQDATKELVSYGVATGHIGENLRMLSDISEGAGVPIAEMAHLYGEARKGGESLSNSITTLNDRNIPIIKELAKQFHVANEEVIGLVNSGKIGFPQFQEALQGMTQTNGIFFQAAERQNNTLSVQYDNLIDSVDQLKISFGSMQGGLLSSLVSGATYAVNLINKPISQSNFKDAATQGLGKSKYDNWSDFDTEIDNRYYYEHGGKAQNGMLDAAKSEDRKTRFDAFSDEIYNTLQNSKKEDWPRLIKIYSATLGAINKQRLAGTMSQGLYINEASVLMYAKKTLQQRLSPDVPINANPTSKNKEINPSTSPQIIIYGGIAPNMIIQSVDGSIPANDLKNKVGQVFLDLISDVNLRTK